MTDPAPSTACIRRGHLPPIPAATLLYVLVEHFVDPTGQGTSRDRNVVDGGATDGSEWRQYGPLPESLAREWGFPIDR